MPNLQYMDLWRTLTQTIARNVQYSLHFERSQGSLFEIAFIFEKQNGD
jgi:hypothetical protein